MILTKSSSELSVITSLGHCHCSSENNKASLGQHNHFLFFYFSRKVVDVFTLQNLSRCLIKLQWNCGKFIKSPLLNWSRKELDNNFKGVHQIKYASQFFWSDLNSIHFWKERKLNGQVHIFWSVLFFFWGVTSFFSVTSWSYILSLDHAPI